MTKKENPSGLAAAPGQNTGREPDLIQKCNKSDSRSQGIFNELTTAAMNFLKSRLSVIPVHPKTKKPILSEWASFIKIPMSSEIAQKTSWPGVGIIAGKVSENLECLDFDYNATLFKPWSEIVEIEAPGLVKRLLHQSTQNGGKHIPYRCSDAVIPGNRKLASGKIVVAGPGEHEFQGKIHKAFQEAGLWYISPCFIETRGEGGYFLASPTPGYKILNGSFSDILEITGPERDILLRAAKALDMNVKPVKEPHSKSNGDRPGDNYNNDGNVQALLSKHGWKMAGSKGDFDHYTRPGKDKGISASLINGRIFNVFTSNAYPLEDTKAYSPFSLYAALEHNGDYEAAARELGRLGFEKPMQAPGPQTKNKTSPKGFTAADLVNMEFPEPRWALDGILPEGLNIIGGKPKAGKSIIALNLGLAIALGGKALQSIDVEKGSVIYLALEDTPRRLKKRLKQMLQYDRAPKDLHLFTEWPRMGSGGIKDLDNLVKNIKDLRLVIIDTLQKIRPPGKANGNLYGEDYDVIARLKKIADDNQVCVLVIHHLRKMEASDPFDMFSGTLGLTGAADGLMVMNRNPSGQMILSLRGRDVEEQALVLEMDPLLLSWKLVGDAAEIKSTSYKQRLFDAFKGSEKPLAPSDLVGITGLKLPYIKKNLPLLLQDGTIRKISKGLYIGTIGTMGTNGTMGTMGTMPESTIDVPFDSGRVLDRVLSRPLTDKGLAPQVPIVPIVPMEDDDAEYF